MTNLREFKKRLYKVSIVRVPAGLCIYNHLDNSNCMTTEERCFVVTGLQGEQWPIRGKDLKKYRYLDDSRIDPKSWYVGDRMVVKTDTSGPHILVYFPQQTEKFPAPASWGMTEPLVANPGDAVAFTMLADGAPDQNDKYVIDKLVFERTYEEV